MTVPPDWLAAVAASPDDDLVRLACADWLDEQDAPECHARAAFIRRQVAEYYSNDPWAESLLPGGSRPMLDEFRGAWLAGLPVATRELIGFERGFAESVTLTSEPGALDAFFGLPPAELTTATGLSFSHHYDPPGWFNDEAAESLAGSPSLARVRDVSLGESVGGRARRLWDSPHLGPVESLGVSCNLLGDDIAASLEGAARLRGVRRFRVSLSNSLPAAAERFAALTTFPRLDRLVCDHPAIVRSRLADPVRLLYWDYRSSGGRDALVLLAEGGVAPRLDSLTLSVGRYVDPVAATTEFLARLDRPILKHLVLRIDLRNKRDYTPLVRAVARCPGVPNLESLSLPKYMCDGSAAVALLTSPHLQKLRRLDINAPIKDSQLNGFLFSPEALARFESVNLGFRWTAERVPPYLWDKVAPRLRPYLLDSATYDRLHPWPPDE